MEKGRRRGWKKGVVEKIDGKYLLLTHFRSAPKETIRDDEL